LSAAKGPRLSGDRARTILAAQFAGKVTDHRSPPQYSTLWCRLPPRILAARDWLTSPTVRQRLARLAGEHPDSDAATALISIDHIH
jgi:hypothetical protein